MWIADGWKEYTVLDTGDGEKLEQWGQYRLIRPDPQVIWHAKRSGAWNDCNAHYHRSSKGGGSWEFFDLPDEWQIHYDLFGHDSDRKTSRMSFCLKPFSFKHTGLFPEQAVNWEWFSQLIAAETDRRKNCGIQQPVKVLNLFAYTGGATVCAAAAGASVTHVDASKGMVQWAKENAAASGLSDAPVRWLVDDCRKFVEREIRRGNHYDALIMDPPSYGRGPGGEVWKMEENIYDFLVLCMGILSEQPLFVLLNSYTTGLQPAVLSYMLHAVLDHRYQGMVSADEIGLPVRNNGLVLPCGAAGRWEA